MENPEIIRNVLLALGWPILVLGSVFFVYKVIQFHKQVKKSVVSKLVAYMVVGWLVSMYSLGIVATVFMLENPEIGVAVTLPIFIIWAITMLVIGITVLRWNDEAVHLDEHYKNLEQMVEKRTKELKKAYKNQIKQEKELREFKERFVFVIAHELRTPSIAINWALEELMQDEEFDKNLSEDHKRALIEIESKNKDLNKLVENLLQVARIQNAEDQDVKLEEVELKDICEEVKSNVEHLAKRNDISIHWNTEKKDCPKVLGNKEYVKEVLTNLVTNAIKYNKDNGWVKVNASTEKDRVVISVEDNGIGMSPQEQEDLFGEFHRIQNKDTSHVSGTGLGLYITKQLVEKMNGSIWVDSEKGKGSTFSFTLPLPEKT